LTSGGSSNPDDPGFFSHTSYESLYLDLITTAYSLVTRYPTGIKGSFDKYFALQAKLLCVTQNCVHPCATFIVLHKRQDLQLHKSLQNCYVQ